MGTLVIFNGALIFAIVLFLLGVKKWIRSEMARRIILLVAPIVTIAFHYSSFIYHLIFTGGGIEYLSNTPNLLLYCCADSFGSDGRQRRDLFSKSAFFIDRAR